MYIGRTVAATIDGVSYNANVDDSSQVDAWNEKIKVTADEEPTRRPAPPVAAPINTEQAVDFMSQPLPQAAPAPAAKKGFFLHIDGDDIPMDGMDTADDGFIQT